jgi:hypothetical protein
MNDIAVLYRMPEYEIITDPRLNNNTYIKDMRQHWLVWTALIWLKIDRVGKLL